MPGLYAPGLYARWAVRGAASLLLCALIVPEALGRVTASADTQAIETSEGGAPGWIGRWDTYLGGFRQLDQMALDGAATGWAVDSVLLAQVDHSVFVRIDAGDLRATQTVDGLDVRGIVLQDGQAFAAGKTKSGGAILTLAPSGRWAPVAYASRALEAIALVRGEPGAGFAVGQGGAVLRLEGNRWLTDPFPEQVADLQAVAALGREDAWAADATGSLWHRGAGGWARPPGQPKLEHPAAISFSAAGRGLAVGAGALAYEGGAWREITPPAEQATSLAWVGERAIVAADGALWQWDGAWSPVPLPTTPIDANLRVTDAVASSGAAWFAAQREGTVISADPQPRIIWPTVGGLAAIDAHLPAEAWAGGEVVGGGLVGSAPRDGGWDQIGVLAVGTSRTIVTGLSLLGAQSGWAVSSSDPTFGSRVFRLTSAGWSEQDTSPAWRLADVQAIAPDDAWAAGYGPVARWNGDSWKVVEEAPFGRVSGPLHVWYGTEGEPEGWFGGWGELVRMSGLVWSHVPLPDATVSDPVIALGPDSQGGAFALCRGLVYHVDAESNAAIVPGPLSDDLIDLSVSPAGQLWVLADPEGLFLLTRDDGWINFPIGVSASRIEPRAIQALDLPSSAESPPVGWEGHDIWLAGSSPGVGRFRVERPTVRAWLPALDR